ncbi:hypothetical protein BDW02DRAFT_561551 [Decorospora gaudefroyi]|uniref:Uncharacterized protein n=1 Tax=Decorospora gaudefroyi TaxID=184978 RepID=A0A6A5JZK7_9PLEO|nr:hypothetical protein BDW02DRAFT_561551 [Decorospora gaudefroyi]
MEAYPKPRHQYTYIPRYGQRGFMSYAGQVANGAAPVGCMSGGYGVGYGMGVGYGVAAAAGAYQPAVYNARPHYTANMYPHYPPTYYANNYQTYPCYGSYGYGYGYIAYASLYPFANLFSPMYQRATYYSTPPYGHPATTTTTYHITNSQAAPTPFRETRPAYSTHGHAQQQGPTREAIQMENRRIATERGSYDARKIRPADARDDDPFWCREINGEWHLRTYYQIENECHPGRWMMDAEIGFLVFHRM